MIAARDFPTPPDHFYPPPPRIRLRGGRILTTGVNFVSARDFFPPPRPCIIGIKKADPKQKKDLILALPLFPLESLEGGNFFRAAVKFV